MKKLSTAHRLIATTFFGSLMSVSGVSVAAGDGWSVVPYVGFS
jgi:hypothetical protein